MRISVVFFFFFIVGLGTYFCYKFVIQWPVCIYVIIRLKMIKSYRETRKILLTGPAVRTEPYQWWGKNKTRPIRAKHAATLLDQTQVICPRTRRLQKTWKLSRYTARSCRHSPSSALWHTDVHSHEEGFHWLHFKIVFLINSRFNQPAEGRRLHDDRHPSPILWLANSTNCSIVLLNLTSIWLSLPSIWFITILPS